jgi:hypothetical protein
MTLAMEATTDMETPLLQSLRNLSYCLNLLFTCMWILLLFIEEKRELCWLEHGSYIINCSR